MDSMTDEIEYIETLDITKNGLNALKNILECNGEPMTTGETFHKTIQRLRESIGLFDGMACVMPLDKPDDYLRKIMVTMKERMTALQEQVLDAEEELMSMVGQLEMFYDYGVLSEDEGAPFLGEDWKHDN